MTRIQDPSRANSSVEGQVGGGGPIGIVGAVEDHGRLPADDLEPAGQTDLGRAFVDQVLGGRAIEEGFDGDDRRRRVVALVSTVDRDEELLVGLAWGAQVDAPPAEGDDVGLDLEVASPASQIPADGSRSKIGRRSPMAAAEHHPAVRLDDAGLLRRHLGGPAVGAVGVVLADVGDDGDVGVDDVGGIEASEQSDLDDGDVDALFGEPDEARPP